MRGYAATFYIFMHAKAPPLRGKAKRGKLAREKRLTEKSTVSLLCSDLMNDRFTLVQKINMQMPLRPSRS